MNRVFFCLIVLFFCTNSFAQTYSLQQCIDSAVAHNIPVKQAGLLTERSQVEWKQSRMNLLPDMNATVTHGLNSGRSIDPFTNSYVNQSVSAASYGINSGIVLFNGLTLQNRVKENASAYEASKMELQQKKDELVLNVMLAYLSVLNNDDEVQLATRQEESTQRSLDRLDVLNKQGAIKPSDLSDLKGQLMNDQLAKLNAKNQLESSKLILAQYMNQSYNPSMKLERINVEDLMESYPSTAAEVYRQSLDQFSLVKSVELRSRSAEYALKATKGQFYPTLSLGAGMNTNYSSVAQNAGQKISYGSQLQNNRYSSIGLGLSIPIFNHSITRNRVKLADIDLKNTELVEENTKLQLQQQIDQAYLNMSNAYDRYKLLLDQVNAYQESFHAAEVRFHSGVGTSVDYLLAKDRLDNANISLVRAKYDFVLRKRILDYYAGKK